MSEDIISSARVQRACIPKCILMGPGCVHTARGGSNRQIIFKIFKVGGGRVQMRWLTPRDAAALMGAPDFPLAADVAPAAACGAFGDAVCADVIAWIAAHYLDPLLTELRVGAPTCDKAV